MKYSSTIGDKKFTFSLDRKGNSIEVKASNGESIDLVHLNNGIFHLLLDNQSFLISATKTIDGISATVNGVVLPVEIEDKAAKLQEKYGSKKTNQKNLGIIQAQIPGLVVRINVSVGDSVEVGTPLFALEAMKMENEIKSPIDGKITKINISVGESVSINSLLMVIK